MNNSNNDIITEKACQGSTQDLIVIKQAVQRRSFKRNESLYSAYYQAPPTNKEIKATNEANSNNSHTKLSSTLFPLTNLSSFAFGENNEQHFFDPKQKQKSSLFAKEKARNGKRGHHVLRRKENGITPIQLLETMKKSEGDTLQKERIRIINKYNAIIGIGAIANVFISLIDINLNVIYSNSLLKNNTSLDQFERLSLLHSRSISIEENTLRIINMALVIIIIASIVLKRKYIQPSFINKNKLSKFSTLQSCSSNINLFAQIIIAIIVYPPYVNKQFIITYKNIVYSLNLQSIFAFFNLFKLFFVANFFSLFNPWNNQIAKAICISYDVSPGLLFSIKACIKAHPVLSSAFMFAFTLLLGETIIRSIEFTVIESSLSQYDKPYVQLVLFHHVLWFIICRAIAYTHSAYHSQTYEGQIVISLISSCLWLLVCFIVIHLTSQLMLTTEERKAYLKLNKLSSQENREAKAATVVTELIQMKKLMIERRGLESQSERTQNYMHSFVMIILLCKDVRDFLDDQKISRCLSVPVDDLLKSFEKKLSDNVNVVKNSVEKTMRVKVDLEALAETQETIFKDLYQLKNVQASLAHYFMNNHNALFALNEKQRMLKKFKKKSFTQKTTQKMKESTAKSSKVLLTPQKMKTRIYPSNNDTILLRPMNSYDFK